MFTVKKYALKPDGSVHGGMQWQAAAGRRAVMRQRLCRLGAQNGPFDIVIRAVLHCGTAHVAHTVAGLHGFGTCSGW